MAALPFDVRPETGAKKEFRLYRRRYRLLRPIDLIEHVVRNDLARRVIAVGGVRLQGAQPVFDRDFNVLPIFTRDGDHAAAAARCGRESADRLLIARPVASANVLVIEVCHKRTMHSRNAANSSR